MSKLKRLYLVIFLVAVASSFWYELSHKTLHPTSWAFYTVNSSEIDINSPTKKVLIDFCNREHSVIDCPPSSERKDDSTNPLGAEYKGVWLANNADIKNPEFHISNQYFTEKVDEFYREYDEKQIHKGVSAVLMALLAFGLFVGLVETIRWIGRGK